MTATRQLAAIMFTDIVGYTALMGRDEQKAFEFLNKNRQIQKPIIEAHNGKWIKELGDGVMASFQTVSDAVNAAIKIQEACTAANDFQLRIGIHLGEVIFENDDVFGDGVNIAARIQAAANPSSIFVSEPVSQNIANKKGIHTRFVRAEKLKNVAEPVSMYEVFTGEKKPEVQHIPHDSPAHKEIHKKSIAVLPFANMSSDPEQEYFSDGITEEIITDLSRLHDLLVISRSSVMTFKHTTKKIKDIAGELNVQYILEGSVRKAGDRLRITAQLIDPATDTHLWAEKYDGTLQNIFDIQENVSGAIVNALKLKISGAEKHALSERPFEDAPAFDCYLKAKSSLLEFDELKFEEAKRYIENGLAITGPNPTLLGGLAYVYCCYANLGIRSDENWAIAEHYARKAIELDENAPDAHLAMGLLYHISKGDQRKSLAHFKKFLSKRPQDMDGMVWMAGVYFYLGNNKEAAERLVETMRSIDPLNEISLFMHVLFHFYSGNYQRALDEMKSLVKRNPHSLLARTNYPLMLIYNNCVNEWLPLVKKYTETEPKELPLKLLKGFYYAYSGDKASVVQLFQNPVLHKWCKTDLQISHLVCDIFAFAGMPEEAFIWLENAVNLGFINYPLLNDHDPFLKRFHHEPKMLDLMQRVKNEWENFDEEQGNYLSINQE
jgi:TolB-like protein/class 3 adenylate cyclase